jgi:hypothetical protein
MYKNGTGMSDFYLVNEYRWGDLLYHGSEEGFIELLSDYRCVYKYNNRKPAFSNVYAYYSKER